MAQFDIHQAVTDSIIRTLETGEAGQWQCPWHRKGGSGLPVNALTGRPYRGINTLALWCAEQANVFDPAVWWYGRPPCCEGCAMGQVLHGSATTT
ncbi:ArdC-like ssDNA-binding domain-containing protein, partial [Methylorubrum aminovorans]|uniref:ArdC-like ssDNA-binding domain-containing protein n=1 Tax=Methylorubrum aminovorans TaxID=269069 RepID=UPI003C30D01A